MGGHFIAEPGFAVVEKPRFMHRHADADLMSLLANSVPPMDVNRVAVFQLHLAKYGQQAQPLKSNNFTSLTVLVYLVCWNNMKRFPEFEYQSKSRQCAFP